MEPEEERELASLLQFLNIVTAEEVATSYEMAKPKENLQMEAALNVPKGADEGQVDSQAVNKFLVRPPGGAVPGSAAPQDANLDVAHAREDVRLGAERLGEERKPHGARRAGEARQEIGAAGVRNEADAREGLDDRGGAGGEHHVAGERDVRARAGGGAVQGAEDRLGQLAHAPHQRVVVRAERDREVDRRRARADVALGEVLAGAEGPPCAREHHDADLGLVRGALHRLAQQLVHLWVERIELVRPVERDREDACVERNQDGRHGRRKLTISPCRKSMRSTESSRSSTRALSCIRARS